MKQQRWPNESELKTMRRRLARVKGSEGLPPDASVVDKAKYAVCKRIVVYMHDNDLNQRELAA